MSCSSKFVYKKDSVQVRSGQGTIKCGILVAQVGGSGDPRRKWEEMGERERVREKREREKCCFCLQNDPKEP